MYRYEVWLEGNCLHEDVVEYEDEAYADADAYIKDKLDEWEDDSSKADDFEVKVEEC